MYSILSWLVTCKQGSTLKMLCKIIKKELLHTWFSWVNEKHYYNTRQIHYSTVLFQYSGRGISHLWILKVLNMVSFSLNVGSYKVVLVVNLYQYIVCLIVIVNFVSVEFYCNSEFIIPSNASVPVSRSGIRVAFLK